MSFIPFKRNYAKPGPGVAPDEPEKFGVARFSQILSIECGTVLKLNLMTLFASIPIITIPPALCAMNAVIRKMMMDEPVMCFADFRDAFAKYWKQSYLVFLLGTLVPIATCVSRRRDGEPGLFYPVYHLSVSFCAVAAHFIISVSAVERGHATERNPSLCAVARHRQAAARRHLLSRQRGHDAADCLVFPVQPAVSAADRADNSVPGRAVPRPAQPAQIRPELHIRHRRAGTRMGKRRITHFSTDVLFASRERRL